MRRRLSGLIASASGLLLLLAVTPVWAHHAFTAEFDANKPIKLKGVVKKMEWINPHSWITIEVKTADGKSETWEVEAGAPNAMYRRGFNKNSLPVGTEIIVAGYVAKDGSRRANGGELTFADGRRLFLGGSNPDDPENKKK